MFLSTNNIFENKQNFSCRLERKRTMNVQENEKKRKIKENERKQPNDLKYRFTERTILLNELFK